MIKLKRSTLRTHPYILTKSKNGNLSVYKFISRDKKYTYITRVWCERKDIKNNNIFKVSIDKLVNHFGALYVKKTMDEIKHSIPEYFI